MGGQVRAQMGATEWLLLASLSFLWGGSFFFVELALTDFGPLTVVSARVALAAVTLWLVILAAGLAVPRAPATWLAFLCMGLLNNVVPFSLIVWAQTEITGSLASILNATTPLFALIVAHLLTRDEKLTGARLSGVLAGFAGVVVIIGPEALAGAGRNLLAQIAVLCAALSYSLAGVFGRRFRSTPALVTAAGQVTCSSLLIAPFALVIEQPWTLASPSPAAVCALIAVAILSTALAYVLYFRILATAGATNLLLVTFLIPVTALLLGVPILGETVSLSDLAGMALIAAGLAVIDGRPLRMFRRPACQVSAG
ncbi:MAG: DMT family transporter [Gammaproteobacteria bacterium]|nr:DMT family transporter [Gammaproteobacteria bacterium]